MLYQESSAVGGAWVKPSEVQSGAKCKLVSETKPSESTYEGKVIKNNVAKIRFQGEEGESKNVNVNKPSINGLIKAFGPDSNQWIGKLLTAHTEKMNVGGRRVTALYLIPEGFELKEDEGGYLVITKIGEPVGESKILATDSIEYPQEEVNVDDIPF